uniref:Phosphatidic acid phosphatase type 2/haloperoxidase domain-containing protein n=1 Tax=Trichobilharzia regenti TaxID=157069 RepID=A0AA85JF90_TRIRE|nr:unnamed protein product [Trichobilharzia regenti]
MSKWTRRLGLALEWTCHGIPWIACVLSWLILLWINNTQGVKVHSSYNILWDKQFLKLSSDEIDTNVPRLLSLLIALLFDAITVGLIKLTFRRQRPKGDNHSDMRLTVGVDAWSFPSGHASRSTMLFFLISYLWLSSSSIKLWIGCLLLLWSIIVCYSRYAMRRHHITDILAGCILGYGEYYLIKQINWNLVALYLSSYLF